jgi:hypothetical protein
MAFFCADRSKTVFKKNVILRDPGCNKPCAKITLPFTIIEENLCKNTRQLRVVKPWRVGYQQGATATS